MIRAVCFDFGNVLGYFDHSRTVRRLLPHTDLGERDLFDALFNFALEDDYEAGRVSTPEYVAEAKRVGRLNCSDAEFLTAFADIFTPNVELCDWAPRLKPRFKLLLGSNTNDAHSRHYRRQFHETLRHFDALVLSQEIGVRKPRLPFFEKVVAAAGCPAAACVFVDDLDANVLAARAAGLHAIHFIGVADLRRRLAELGVTAG